tara:strand:+ start:181 stop:372 length:192 start_codon:yes stop_codon:yes gene_type:complete
MPLPNRELRTQIQQDLSDAHPQIGEIFKALDAAENLLQRSLYEFGSELRNEIESFLGESPLIK